MPRWPVPPPRAACAARTTAAAWPPQAEPQLPSAPAATPRRIRRLGAAGTCQRVRTAALPASATPTPPHGPSNSHHCGVPRNQQR
eukprot:scaffold130455_cov69-Phaeocystis_antarctica.AAC.9